MKIKTRLSSYAVLLAVIPLLVTCAIVGIQAYNLSQESLRNEVITNLASRRNLKRSEITGYLQSVEKQIVAQAHSLMLKEASREFTRAFNAYAEQLSADNPLPAPDKLNTYYKQEFNALYQSRNGKGADIGSILAGLSDTTRALQHHYIANNPHPLGEKNNLAFAADNSQYQSTHQRYHDSLNKVLNLFGYYDIFIVSPAGDVVYSVYKELDFATSLTQGPYSQSGLAEAFKHGKKLQAGQTHFTQFSPYTPSYEAAAAFAASPVFDAQGLAGVLIFQMPVDEINRVMTFNGDWSSQDMGESAEIYLVDKNRKILNNSRFFEEDKPGFLALLKSLNSSSDLIRKIDLYDTTVGFMPIDTPSATAALEGKTGAMTVADYRNVQVISAYAPLDFANLNWAILSEVDAAEALAPITILRNTLLTDITLFALLALAISIALGIWIARSISNPIQLLSNRVQHVANNFDFRDAIPEKGDQELQELAGCLNSLISSLRDSLNSVLQATQQLSSNAQDIKNMTTDISGDAERQAQESTMVATAATQLQSTAQEVARNAATTADSTRDSLSTARNAQGLAHSSSGMSATLASEIQHVSDLLQQVAKESESIGAVLDVINGIAEQTNLLALNAAIEAARAGEQGRGFAVVADEVRQLAQRTQSATTEIDQMISSLQKRSQEAVTAMEKDKQITEDFVSGTQEITGSVEQVTQLISDIADMNLQVATAAEQQTSVVDEISQNADAISDLANTNSERTLRLHQNSEQLDQLSHSLQKIVATYKV